jgi:hypothetical protein
MNLEFEKFLSRHGEFGVQALIERLERYEGIRSKVETSLEERWVLLMQPTPGSDFRMAS